jgi:hypothetical protein
LAFESRRIALSVLANDCFSSESLPHLPLVPDPLAPASDAIAIRLIGPTRITWGERELALPASRKTRAILAYLLRSAASSCASCSSTCPTIRAPRCAGA